MELNERGSAGRPFSSLSLTPGNVLLWTIVPLHTPSNRERMAPHSPGAGPGARPRSGTGRAARAGPGRQKRDRAFPIFSQHEPQLHDLVVQHGPKLLQRKQTNLETMTFQQTKHNIYNKTLVHTLLLLWGCLYLT